LVDVVVALLKVLESQLVKAGDVMSRIRAMLRPKFNKRQFVLSRQHVSHHRH
jgi:hypothetical protein